MQATAYGNYLKGNACHFSENLKMNDGLLLSQESSTKPVTPEGLGRDFPKGKNGLWAPLDLLKCTSSADKDAISDGMGPNFAAALGSIWLFQGNSLSLSHTHPNFVFGLHSFSRI